MGTKLHKIDELSKLLDDKNELAGNLMDLYRHFNLSQAMSSCKITKLTGVSCSLLMLFLILSRLMSISKYQLYRHHYFDLDRITYKKSMLAERLFYRCGKL